MSERRSPGSDATPSQSSLRVETGKGHKRGARGRGRVARIQQAATERQDAWLESGRPLVTYQLTVELEGLYGDLRDSRKGERGPDFNGNTSAVHG